MVIAATHSDEVNMVVCQVANSVFDVQRTIARLRAQAYLAPEYSDLYRRDNLPIDVIISPEQEVAEAALQRLGAPAAFDTESFLDDQAQLIGLAIDDDCPVINTPLRQLTDLFSTLRAIVVGIRRREGRLFAPTAEDQIFAGDDCYIFTHVDDIGRTFEIFGKPNPRQDRVVIIGGGNVGLAVARALESRAQRVRVKVIERNRANAERAADSLNRTIVLHGDGLDAALLDEANIASADAVLVVTDDDKTNLLAAVRAKEMGCKLAICLVNDPTLVSLMGPLAIDAYINPRATRCRRSCAISGTAGALGLFDRRCRGRDDRGTGSVDLAAGGPEDPRHCLSRRRARRRHAQERQVRETDRRNPHRRKRCDRDVRHGQRRAGSRAAVAGLDRLLLMYAQLTRVPFFVLLMGIGSAAMLVPVGHALVNGNRSTAAAFFLGFILAAC